MREASTPRQVFGASPGVSAGPHTRQVFSGLGGAPSFLWALRAPSFSGLSGNTGANASTLRECVNFVPMALESSVPSQAWLGFEDDFDQRDIAGSIGLA